MFLVYVWKFLPETRNRPIDEIIEEFMKKPDPDKDNEMLLKEDIAGSKDRLDYGSTKF